MTILLGYALGAACTTAIFMKRYHAMQQCRNDAIADRISMDQHVRKTNFMLSAISHDLRTPLNALMLQAELAKQGLYNENFEMVESALADIAESAEMAGNLLCHLLDYARLDISDIEEVSDVDIYELVEKITKAFTHIAAKKGLHIATSCPVPAVIMTDRVKLFRIISNLIDNAIKHTLCGTITVSIANLPDTITISVADEGEGIAKHDLKQIFEAFYQVGNRERDSEKGYGLGLAICGKLVGQLGGRINATSELGKGSCFEIIIPKIKNTNN